MAYLERFGARLLAREDDGPFAHLQPVFAPAAVGHPLGRLVAEIGYSARAHYGQGLMMQVFGHRNLIPCACCEASFQQQQVGIGDGTYFDCTMQPFHECISMNFADGTGLDNFAWGQRGNCLWKVRGL